MLQLLAHRRMRNGLREDSVLLLHLVDLGLRPGQPYDRRVEQFRILADFLGTVVCGIDGDEDDPYRLIVRGLPPQFDEARQRRRADVPAARESEINCVGLPGERFAGKRFAVAADQRERSAKA